MKKAFSLIELSIVILIIGILVAGVTQGSRLVGEFRLKTAQNLTQSSPVTSIKDLVLWLETSSPTALSDANSSFDLNDGDSLQTWFDINPQISDKKNFTAPSSGKRPTYKTNAINSLPAVLVDRAATKYFENTSGVLTTSDNTYTIATVSKATTTITGSTFYFVFGQAGVGGLGNLAGMVYSGASGAIGLATGADNDYYPISTASNPLLITLATVNGNSVSVYGNSKTANSTTLGSTNNGPNGLTARIGSAPYNESEVLSGYIAEIIVFDRVLKTEEINSILQYLGSKYGVKI